MVDEKAPFEYMSEDTFFSYMTPESLARMNPGLREIQVRVEARSREIERTTPRSELERQLEEEKRLQEADLAKQRRYELETRRGVGRGSMAREARFVTEWRMVLDISKRESWGVDRVKDRLAGCVARHLGQDDARGRGRVMDVFAEHGGKATRDGVVSLLREGVSTSEGFKWLAHRAGQYSGEGVTV